MKSIPEDSGIYSLGDAILDRGDINIELDNHWRLSLLHKNVFQLIRIPSILLNRRHEVLMWIELCIMGLVMDFLIMIWYQKNTTFVIILTTAAIVSISFRVIYYLKKLFFKDSRDVINSRALTGWTYRYSSVLLIARMITLNVSVIILFLLSIFLHDVEVGNLFFAAGMIVMFLIVIYFLSDCPEYVAFRAVGWDILISVLLLNRLLLNDFVYNIVRQFFIFTLNLFDQTKEAGVFLFGQFYYKTFLIRLFCFFSVGSIISSKFIESGAFIAVLKFMNGRSEVLMNSAIELICILANVLISPLQSIFITTLLLDTLNSQEINTILASCLVATMFTTDSKISKILPGRHIVSAHLVTAFVLCGISKLFYPIAKKSIKLTDDAIKALENKLHTTKNMSVHCILSLGRFWTYACASTIIVSGIIMSVRLVFCMFTNTLDFSMQMAELENVFSVILYPLVALILKESTDREKVAHYFSVKNIHSNEYALKSLSQSMSSRWIQDCWMTLKDFQYLPTYTKELSSNMAYLKESKRNLTAQTSMQFLFPVEAKTESIMIYLLSGMNSFLIAGVAIMLITALNYNRRQAATKVLLDAYITAIFTVVLLCLIVTVMYDSNGDAVCFVPGISSNLTCQLIAFKIHQQRGIIESSICQDVGGIVTATGSIYSE